MKASSQEGEGAHPLHSPTRSVPGKKYSSSLILSASLWSHLPLENEDNETRAKFSRYPLRSISPSE